MGSDAKLVAGSGERQTGVQQGLPPPRGKKNMKDAPKEVSE
jgi:hypothetical protein